MLAGLYEVYARQEDLKPGDLVQWKKGLSNALFPRYDVPAVLVEIVVGNRQRRGEGAMDELQPCEARIGMVTKDGVFGTWLVDINRLEKYASAD